MSLKTWKAEFYPTTAKQSARGSALNAARHSLQKWTGLTKASMKRHGVRINGYREVQEAGASEYRDDSFVVDDESCSLCEKFFGDPRYDDDCCIKCPLYKTLGGKRCDGDKQPYLVWADTQDPAPMIAALRKTVKRLEKEAKR